MEDIIKEFMMKFIKGIKKFGDIIVKDKYALAIFLALMVAPLIGIALDVYLKVYQSVEVEDGAFVFTSIFLIVSLSYYFIELLKRVLLEDSDNEKEIDSDIEEDRGASCDNQLCPKFFKENGKMISIFIGIMIFLVFSYVQFSYGPPIVTNTNDFIKLIHTQGLVILVAIIAICIFVLNYVGYCSKSPKNN